MYLPKSQIETNLYSNNNLAILDTGVLYTGFYWATSNGKFFVGKTPEDPNSSTELVKASANAASNVAALEPNLGEEQPFYVYNLKNLDYLRLTETEGKPPSNPKYSPAQPTVEDYQQGYFQRYFCKKVNEGKFIEISVEEYLKLKNKDGSIAYNLYTPFILSWSIAGNKEQVAIKNKNAVDFLQKPSKGFAGLEEYIKYNYLQFYGLYTSGGEFLLPNGKNYVGFYHIHPNQGPMVGIRHTLTSHAILTQISSSQNLPTNQSLSQTSNIYNGSPNTSGGY